MVLCMITIYNSSFRYKSDKVSSGNKRPCRRGKITGFSSASSKRLKDVILSINTFQFFGFTLTFPSFDDSSFDYHEHFRQFKQAVKRKLNIGFVWRLEKQLNGRPHYHCLMPVMRDYCAVFFRIKSLWKYYLRLFSIPYTWDEYFLNFQIVNSSTALNYLVLHASKHKQQQLVSCGRSWGVVNRSVLDFRKFDLRLPKFYSNLIVRTYRRYLSKLGQSSYDSFFVIKYSSLFRDICVRYLKSYFPIGFDFSQLFL